MLRIGVLVGVLVLSLTGPAVWAEDPPGGDKGAQNKAAQPVPAETIPIDGGDTAWVLASTGLVLLMVPGLALFYGGMVRRKNILSTMMQSMVALAIIGIQWMVFGYSLAFGESQAGLFGWNTN